MNEDKLLGNPACTLPLLSITVMQPLIACNTKVGPAASAISGGNSSPHPSPRPPKAVIFVAAGPPAGTGTGASASGCDGAAARRELDHRSLRLICGVLLNRKAVP